MRVGIVMAAIAAGLVGCPSRSGHGAECPQAQRGPDGKCLPQLCEAGAARCGSACCAAGQTCGPDGHCRGQACDAATPCPGGQTCKVGYCLSSDPACTYTAQPGPFEPRIAWQWTGSTTLPDYRDVLMTPVVFPLSRDTGDVFAPPAVIFNAIRGDQGAAEEVEGVMRAVRGDDGTDLWTSDPDHKVNGLTGIAAGDLAGDGHVTLVTGRFTNGDPTKDGVVAFDGNGHFLWEVIGPRIRWGAPTIANLTGGPEAQVIVGATVIDAHGKILCTGAFGQGSNFMGPISAVADVDLDGKPEIVTGNAVYDASCQPKPGWPAKYPDGQTLREDGTVAVADVTGDGHPEIVVVAAGQVRLHDWQGHLLWGPFPLPGGGAGGPPTVADFDGDGKLEIGVASRSTYSVLKPFAANPVVWSKPTQDHSDVTGSSVFDFTGSGQSAVVYGDECYTRVYAGKDGASLFEAQNPSCTTQENPVIADVNRDGRAEIVVATNSVCNYQCPWGAQYGSAKGITVYKDLNDRWVGTRSIWNQHAYDVSNVNDDGTIPWPAPNFWQLAGTNAFRKNTEGSPTAGAPDLAADSADVSIDPRACPATLSITVKVWNRGAVPVAPGVPVTFRSDPGGVVWGTVDTKTRILPGQSEDVTLVVGSPPRTPGGVAIQLNADASGKGVVGECDTSNDLVKQGDAFCPDLGL